MRYRIVSGLLLILLAATMILSGCQVQPPQATPTPSPEAIPSSTVERPPVPPTGDAITPVASTEVSPQAISPGGATVVPILYKMYDWGTDFQEGASRMGARRLHPIYPLGNDQSAARSVQLGGY